MAGIDHDGGSPVLAEDLPNLLGLGPIADDDRNIAASRRLQGNRQILAVGVDRYPRAEWLALPQIDSIHNFHYEA
ncbi:hypothetical protein D2E76_27135 [Mycobacteroides abscessus]|uniref:Uncharacterized protein n=1 Tax=Mycobacteroides abscessus TaxID=36809 RepID=A0ABD7HGD1_9MYCO|nr:hypothetical protein D2E45_23040 [Mycobacteroides abscessus]RIT28682.1 hypothetical protein D2E76_27135 [Mycobacteroides abscessus]